MTTTTNTNTNASTAADAYTPKNVPVHTAAPVKVDEGKQVIFWSRRSTDKNPVAAALRYRGIVIDAAQLAIPGQGTSSKFMRLLQDTINDLAAKKFQDFIKDRMTDKEVDSNLFTVDAVMNYYAEAKAAQTIDAEKVKAWLEASATVQAFAEATRKAWLAKLPKMCAPGYAMIFNAEQAATIISRLSPEDMESAVGEFIVTRCNNIISKGSEEDAL